MRHTERLLVLSGVIVAMLAGAATAPAADSAQRQAWARRSGEQALGGGTVPILRRVPGKGREAVMDTVLRRFADSDSSITTRGDVKPELVRDRLGVADGGWFLEVSGDGTQASYRNYGFLDKRLDLARPVEERMSDSELHKLGRQFIAEYLEGLIRIGDDEEIVPLFTEFQIGGGGSTRPGSRQDPEYVAASAVVFTRTIGGVPVVGAGSKIAVIFDNEGQPAGFDFDWPIYEKTGREQQTVSRGEVEERMERLAGFTPRAEGFKVERFECGYFDPGTRRRDAEALVQAACSIQATRRSIVDQAAYRENRASGHLLTATSVFIPAGAVVEADRKWPEAQAFLGKPVRGREPHPGGGPGSEDFAPGEKVPESDAERR